MYWEDNPLSKNYNTLCQGKKKTNENLFRKDSLYDIILVINYNIRPVIPHKGSAIFIHVSKTYFKQIRFFPAMDRTQF